MLTSSFPPIPAKLVASIQSLQFVELKELLPDNIAVCEQGVLTPSARGHDHPLKQRGVLHPNLGFCLLYLRGDCHSCPPFKE